MVELFTISRLGGVYTSTVFPFTGYTNPSVTIKLTKWSWQFKDVELAIDIPETESDQVPKTLAGGFKRITKIINVEGYLDATPTGEGNAQTKLEKLWNIAEYGDPSNTFGVYRGRDLFDIAESANDGELKITSLQMDEDATTSEPAQDISGTSSKPKRIKIRMQLRKMKRDL